jgi:hypothetical protein
VQCWCESEWKVLLFNASNTLKRIAESNDGLPFLIVIQSYSRFCLPKKGWKLMFFSPTFLEWPNLTIYYSFISIFFGQLFFDITHMHAFYPVPNFYGKWSTTSQSKSSKSCNFENCLKLESLNFLQWQFFIFYPIHFLFSY